MHLAISIAGHYTAAVGCGAKTLWHVLISLSMSKTESRKQGEVSETLGWVG